MNTRTLITWAALAYIIYELSKSGSAANLNGVSDSPTGRATYPGLPAGSGCPAGLYQGQLQSETNPYYVKELANAYNAGWLYSRPFTFQSE
jgi:hypothetical protein